ACSAIVAYSSPFERGFFAGVILALALGAGLVRAAARLLVFFAMGFLTGFIGVSRSFPRLEGGSSKRSESDQHGNHSFPREIRKFSQIASSGATPRLIERFLAEACFSGVFERFPR